jgi:hypothetical protein
MQAISRNVHASHVRGRIHAHCLTPITTVLINLPGSSLFQKVTLQSLKKKKVTLQGVIAPMPYHERPSEIGDSRAGPTRWLR